MPPPGPEATIQKFFDAFNRADLDRLMALYEPNAVMVAQPGAVVEGHAAVRAALTQMLAMKPTLTLVKQSYVVSGDLASAIVRAQLAGTGPDGAPVHMDLTSSDVLRRQPGGAWLLVIDNPWGAAIVG